MALFIFGSISVVKNYWQATLNTMPMVNVASDVGVPMRCIFCDKRVCGAGGMSVANLGVAHQQCFMANEALRRTFQSLDIRALSDQELVELKDLVLAEENSRRPAGDVDVIELF